MQKFSYPKFNKNIHYRNTEYLKFRLWNIETLTGKTMKATDTMFKRKINILCLQ